MLFYKFVTNDFNSPGPYGQLDYSHFGKLITVDAAPKSDGQCAAGIHVMPYGKTIDFENVIFSDKLIVLEANEEDIVFQEGNGKIRLSKAIPLREATLEEYQSVKNEALKSADYAYYYALRVDTKPFDSTRTAVLNSAELSHLYALQVDKCYREDTFTALKVLSMKIVIQNLLIDRLHI